MITIPDYKIKEVMQGVIDQFLSTRFVELGMNASGKWLESLQADAVDGVGYIKGMDYTVQLVNGRAPGNMPPVEPLRQWVGNKLGIQGQQGLSVAWAIAKKIEREGTDYYPEGTTLLEVLNEPIVMDYIYNEMGAFMNGKIKIEIERKLSEVWQTPG